MKKIICTILSLLLMMSGVAAAEQHTIKIGVFEPLSGTNAAGGTMEYEGILAAHDLFPDVLGLPVELVVADNKSDDTSAVDAAQALVDAGVSVVLGSWGSSLSLAGGEVFEAAGVPAIGTSCTNPKVTLGHDHYFRVCYLDDFQGAILADFAKQQLGAERAAVVCDIGNIYAMGLRDYFIESFGEDGLRAEAYFEAGKLDDYDVQIESVMKTNPDVILVLGNYADAAQVMKQVREMGYNDVKFLGGDTLEVKEFVDIGGEATEGCYFSTFFDTESELTKESEAFMTAYEARFDRWPDGAVTALGYDAYVAAVKAIEAAGSYEPQSVTDALWGLEFDGATGRCAFDQNGDAVKDRAVVKTVKDGEFTYVKTVILN